MLRSSNMQTFIGKYVMKIGDLVLLSTENHVHNKQLDLKNIIMHTFSYNTVAKLSHPLFSLIIAL